MKIEIGAYDPDRRVVGATFSVEGKAAFVRSINACHTADGGYDEAATAARVEEVATGVQLKFDLGLIGNPVHEIEATETAAA